MKDLFMKLIVKFFLMIGICAVITFIYMNLLSSVGTVITNELAVGQLSNSNEAFIALETWNGLKNSIWHLIPAYIVVSVTFIGSSVLNVLTYLNNKEKKE